jgi:hypothetical protein
MKKTFLLILSMGVLLLALPAQAGLFTMDLATLEAMTKTWDAANTTSLGLTVVNEGTSVLFSASMQYGDGTGDGWASMGLGFAWPPPAGLSDLTAYDGYALTFENTNNSSWLVNLYINTGWTDPPANETNNFYQSEWVKLEPFESVTIVLDFATLVNENGPVVNLNHVTNIGFQVGGDMDDSYDGDSDPSNPDWYHINVAPIPEPATLALLGLGAVLLRKRK